jgi:hypothetical protein
MSDKSKKGKHEASAEQEVETRESARLKALAYQQLLRKQKPADDDVDVVPVPGGLAKYDATDIVNKSASRGKRRYFFMLPGRFETLLAAGTGGARLGSLSRMSTPNPILYIDFPTGRLCLRGTIMYPAKKRYLAM